MSGYLNILERRLHGESELEVAPIRPEVPESRAPVDAFGVFRRNKIAVALSAAAAAGIIAALLTPNNSAGTSVIAEPQVVAGQNPQADPTKSASGATAGIFKQEPKLINVSFSGINTVDGCVTNVVTFAEQTLLTKPLGAYQREIEIIELEATTTTCIDDGARLFKTEGQLDVDTNIVPLTVGLDATSLRTSAEITKAQFKIRTVLPGENLSATACDQIPVPGCAQNPIAPLGIDLDPTAEKAIIATVEAIALQELQKTCAAPIYKAAAQIPAQILFDQLPGQKIPDSYLTFQIVDQNNKLFGKVPNFAATPLAELEKSGATLKAAEQAVILGKAKPVLTDCGVKND
jgi:hypothetical protein